jgi:transposase
MKSANTWARFDGSTPLSGVVEADETYVGGKRKGMRERGAASKTVVFCLLEKNGDVMMHVVLNVRRAALQPIVEVNVVKGSGNSCRDWIPAYNC